MLKYEYMIIYKGVEGWGRCSLTRNKEIESYSDVKSIDDSIKDADEMHNKFVTDFKLLRVFEE